MDGYLKALTPQQLLDELADKQKALARQEAKDKRSSAVRQEITWIKSYICLYEAEIQRRLYDLADILPKYEALKNKAKEETKTRRGRKPAEERVGNTLIFKSRKIAQNS